MASIRKLEGKGGISYKITVTEGRRSDGKQIRHYMTYTPPKGMSESKARKEAEKLAAQFEQKFALGYQADSRETFEAYAARCLQDKRRAGLKDSTYQRYQLLLKRINPAIGHIKLQDIRPQHLNALYDNLMEEGLRTNKNHGRLKVDLLIILKGKGYSRAHLAREAHVAASTITKVLQGDLVTWETAEAIAKTLAVEPTSIFKREVDQTPLSDKTVLEHHRLIRTILAQAEKELLVPYNAAAKATPPKAKRTGVNSFQPEEIVAILRALESEPLLWRCLVTLMIVTGCRRGEIMGLQWRDVDFEKETIEIRQTLLSLGDGVHIDTPKTSQSQRIIKIPSEAVALLRDLKAYQDEWKAKVGDLWEETGFIFAQDNGKPMHPDSINGWLNKFSDRHSLPHINPHAFRHTMASILISNGTDILAVSRRLGHANTTTTLNVYSHALAQADASASDCIADVLLKK